MGNEGQQVQLVGELAATARTLAHSTHSVDVPLDSYWLLSDLRATVESLAQVCQQLSAWHEQVVDGHHYEGEDTRGDGATGTVAAAAELQQAAAALATAGDTLRRAHAANGVVRWYDNLC